MIRLIEALRYRCLRDVSQDLDEFHVLVGPNASGKTTFLDVVALLGDLVAWDLDLAISDRSQNFLDLVWVGSGKHFELAIELEVPQKRRELLEKPSYSLARYEVALGLDPKTDELWILTEKVLLKERNNAKKPQQRRLFPTDRGPRQTLLSPKTAKNVKTVVNKVHGGNDNFYDETGKGWDHAFKLGPRKSALANLPEDESKFPVATWLKGLLTQRVERLVLNSALMRSPSRPGQPKIFLPDGSNLPWVVEDLKKKHPDRHKEWVCHLRTALPDLQDVTTVERPEDRHRYLVLHYRDGVKVPSWTASDGTLRLLALTLPAYLRDFEGIYLIEEPENGIHPRAVETMFQSLSSVYGAQILMATHSPVILSLAESSQVLCFAKTKEGATDIVRGSEHPALNDWKGEENLGVLFAGGVLG